MTLMGMFAPTAQLDQSKNTAAISKAGVRPTSEAGRKTLALQSDAAKSIAAMERRGLFPSIRRLALSSENQQTAYRIRDRILLYSLD